MNRIAKLQTLVPSALLALLFSASTQAAGAASNAMAEPLLHAGEPPPMYHLIRSIPVGGDGGWDYLAMDSDSGRVFISRGTHVIVVDIKAGVVVGDIPDTAGVHGIAIDAKAGRGFTSNGRSNTVTIFDLKTLKKIGDVPVGQGPDCILFDAASDRVFTFNGRAQSATAIDAATGKVAGTIALPGRPEFAVADGRGHIYNNLEDKNSVVSLDSRTLKVNAVWPLGAGEGPSGIAMDVKTRRLFSVCDNKQMVVLDADSGKVVAAPAIGAGPDACAFDPAEKLVFSPNGEDGTMTLIDESSASKFIVAGTFPTAAGARTMTLDTKTHHIFTVSAKIAPAAPAASGAPQGRVRPSYEPNSFVLLEYGP